MIRNVLLLIGLFISAISFSQGNRDVFYHANDTPQQNVDLISKVATYPNPFIENTQISFVASERQEVLFQVKNLLGKVVFQISIEAKTGLNKYTFHKDQLLSGMYIYSIQTDKNVISKRFVIR